MIGSNARADARAAVCRPSRPPTARSGPPPPRARALGRAAIGSDSFGRPLRDLRISVTDRCNFRCVYCMPKEVFGREYRFLERSELLSFEEIERVSRVLVAG